MAEHDAANQKQGTPRHPEDLVQHMNFRHQNPGRAALAVPVSGSARWRSCPAHRGLQRRGHGRSLRRRRRRRGEFIAAPCVERGDLVPVLSEFAVDRSAITALWPESQRSSPNVKTFIAFLGELFPSPAPWDVLVAQTSRLCSLTLALPRPSS
jgi:hypothetical protein